MKPATFIYEVKNEFQTKMWGSEKLLISVCSKFNRLDAKIPAVREATLVLTLLQAVMLISATQTE